MKMIMMIKKFVCTMIMIQEMSFSWNDHPEGSRPDKSEGQDDFWGLKFYDFLFKI